MLIVYQARQVIELVANSFSNRYFILERIMLSDVSHIVIDEADTLLDQSFADEVTEVVRQVKVMCGCNLLPLLFIYLAHNDQFKDLSI